MLHAPMAAESGCNCPWWSLVATTTGDVLKITCIVDVYERRYVAVGDGFACLQREAVEIGVSMFCKMRNVVMVICEMDCEMNIRSYG